MQPFQCPHCGGAFQIPPNLAGQAVACPHCNGGVFIPETASQVAPPPIPQAAPPPVVQAASPPLDPWQPPVPRSPAHPPISETAPAPPIAAPPKFEQRNPGRRSSALDQFEPPQRSSPLITPSAALPSPNPRTPVEAESQPQRQFVIPTIDGGQTTILEPIKTVTSGRKSRRLAELTSEQKSLRRRIKNVIVAGCCAAILMFLMWWLLN